MQVRVVGKEFLDLGIGLAHVFGIARQTTQRNGPTPRQNSGRM